GALAGLRVIAATTGIAGPLAAMFLADFGADVVKIEPPGGDPSRDRPGSAVWNRGKRGGLVDPGDGRSTGVHDELLRTADVLVTDAPSDGEAAHHPGLVRLVMP